MAVQLVPVGPDIPEILQPLLRSHEDAIRDLQNPGAPVVLPKIALAASLPDAGSYRDCAIQVVDKNCIAISTEATPGTWSWKRADGGTL